MPDRYGKNMNKNMAFVSSCLLLFSIQVLADRPAVSEQNTGPELLDPITESEAADPKAPVFETADDPVQSPLEEAIKQEALEEAMDETPVTESVSHETTQTTTQTGDVIELRSGDTLPVHVLDFPHRGMSMSNVQKELGEPLGISATIGDPPITSWSYNDRTVYFERSRVIHAVSNN
jgi:hypothetical protein